jgi:hypothetical protein
VQEVLSQGLIRLAEGGGEELAKCKLDIVTVQVTWNKGGAEPADDYTVVTEMGMIITWGQTFSYTMRSCHWLRG